MSNSAGGENVTYDRDNTNNRFEFRRSLRYNSNVLLSGYVCMNYGMGRFMLMIRRIKFLTAD